MASKTQSTVEVVMCVWGGGEGLFVTRQRKLYLPKTLVEPQVGMASKWGNAPIDGV